MGRAFQGLGFQGLEFLNPKPLNPKIPSYGNRLDSATDIQRAVTSTATSLFGTRS